MDFRTFEKRIYSQNGEDGITMKLIELIYHNSSDKYYVEFGVENGKECNTRVLRENYNWRGLQMDGGFENLKINLNREFITRENVVGLFQKYKVPQLINLLSIDVDFNDFYILHEILKHYSCDIIIVEYNGFHGVTEDKIIKYDSKGRWDHSVYFGASLLALNKLCELFGYSLVYSNGVNGFFVRKDILTDKNIQVKNAGSFADIYCPAGFARFGEDKLKRAYVSFDEAIIN